MSSFLSSSLSFSMFSLPLSPSSSRRFRFQCTIQSLFSFPACSDTFNRKSLSPRSTVVTKSKAQRTDQPQFSKSQILNVPNFETSWCLCLCWRINSSEGKQAYFFIEFDSSNRIRSTLRLMLQGGSSWMIDLVHVEHLR